jgi:hypothetical protein
VAPFNNQFHMTDELTGGIIDNVSLGFMLLSAKRPGYGLDYSGWRLLPHFYVPEEWHWPIGVGLVAEFSFQRTAFEENSRRVEIRPILETTVGRWQIDLNPVFERALHGPGTRDGWNFEPAARLGYKANNRFTPSLEYYSETGPFPTELPLGEQIHQFLPGGDLRLSDRLLWSSGVDIGGDIGRQPSDLQIAFRNRVWPRHELTSRDRDGARRCGIEVFSPLEFGSAARSNEFFARMKESREGRGRFGHHSSADSWSLRVAGAI